ncbi:MAG: hypothetical protein JXA96_17660 [Sedimentisphaerales bacterium]|nr:hypothetical protein [Sedimentisphaerales bacterium]
MKSYLSLFLVVFAIIGFGCIIHVDTPPDYDDGPVEIHEYPAERMNSNFDARLEATNSMMNFMEQDAALSSIALDAANELDIEHTLKALSKINNFMTQDSAAENCVTPFINENMISEASSVAEIINNFMIKDRVLTRIAQGPDRN